MPRTGTLSGTGTLRRAGSTAQIQDFASSFHRLCKAVQDGPVERLVLQLVEKVFGVRFGG